MIQLQIYMTIFLSELFKHFKIIDKNGKKYHNFLIPNKMYYNIFLWVIIYKNTIVEKNNEEI